jgi:hypothetical protein
MEVNEAAIPSVVVRIVESAAFSAIDRGFWTENTARIRLQNHLMSPELFKPFTQLVSWKVQRCEANFSIFIIMASNQNRTEILVPDFALSACFAWGVQLLLAVKRNQGALILLVWLHSLALRNPLHDWVVYFTQGTALCCLIFGLTIYPLLRCRYRKVPQGAVTGGMAAVLLDAERESRIRWWARRERSIVSGKVAFLAAVLDRLTRWGRWSKDVLQTGAGRAKEIFRFTVRELAIYQSLLPLGDTALSFWRRRALRFVLDSVVDDGAGSGGG